MTPEEREQLEEAQFDAKVFAVFAWILSLVVALFIGYYVHFKS